MQPDQFPIALLDELKTLEGFDTQVFQAAMSVDASVSVRLNVAKPSTHNLNLAQPIDWCEGGYSLASKPNFALDPLWHAGAYYVQEASSMVLDYVLRACLAIEAADNDEEQSPKLALDLCAAPGGKTTILTDALPAGSFVVANEIIRNRNAILVQNMARWGSPYLAVSQNEPEHWGNKFAGVFDVLLIDAPCSGSGMFRKNNTALDQWSEKNVEFCAWRQKQILSACTAALARDGLLIYSTCSYSKAENEDISDFLVSELGFVSVDISPPPGPTILKTYSDKTKAVGFRLMPGYGLGEGLYIACFRQSESANALKKIHTKAQKAKKPDFIGNEWARLPDACQVYQIGDYLHLLPEIHAPLVAELQQKAYLRKAGIALGTMAGKDFVPGAEFALLAAAGWHKPIIKLAEAQAIEYLKGKPPAPLPDYKGWQLMGYQNLILGWAKAIGQRTNNYYPSAWVIGK